MLRLIADMDSNHAIVKGVQCADPAIEFQSSRCFPDSTHDLSVLAYAARQGLVLVSHDVSTMTVHFNSFSAHTPSPGVILVPQLVPVGQAVRALVDFARSHQPEEIANCLRWLPHRDR